LEQELGTVLLRLDGKVHAGPEQGERGGVHLVAPGGAGLRPDRAGDGHRGLLAEAAEAGPGLLGDFLLRETLLQGAGAVPPAQERDLAAGAERQHPALDGDGGAFVAREFGDAGGGHDQRGRGAWRRGRGAWSLAAALLTVNAGCSGYRPVP